MTKCLICGRENVLEHEGYKAPCGRYVTWNDAPSILYPSPTQWKQRLEMAQACQKEKERCEKSCPAGSKKAV